MKTACREPGCPAILEDDYCGRHKPPKDTRPSASRRGYDHRWKKTRDTYLAQHRRCEDPFLRHDDRPPRATEVDHIRPLNAGGAKHDPRNLMATCRGCHARKTRRDATAEA